MKTKECPACHETVPSSASRCKHCWHDFTEVPKSSGLMAGLVMMLVSMAGMAVVGSLVLLWLVAQPIDERILVDADTESVIWTTRYRTHTDTERLRYSDVAQVEHVTLRTGGCEIRLKRTDGSYKVLQEAASSLGSEARVYAEKMGKPFQMIDNTGGFHKMGG